MQASTAAQSDQHGWSRWALALFVAITFALGNSVGTCASGGFAKIEERVRAVEVWNARIDGKLTDIDRRLERMERKIDDRATAR